MKTGNDLGRDSVPSLVLKLAIPTMVAQFVNVLYSIIDRMYIGHIPEYGDLALAGAGICGPIVTLLSSFGTLVGLGGSIQMSIRMGERNMKKARQILSNSLLLLTLFSAVLTVLFLMIKGQLLRWFGASDQTFAYANTYLTIYTIGTFFALMATGMNYFITAQGFPGLGMTTTLIGAILNIFLDPLFMFGFHMGIAGAAIATVLSQMASCAFVLLVLFRKNMPVLLKPCAPQKKLTRSILSLGFSPFLILATDSLLLIALNAALQYHGGPGLGDTLITCATIAQSFLMLITSPMIGITGGCQSLISFNNGAKRPDRIRRIVFCVLILCVCFTSFMFVMSRIFSVPFSRIFTSDASQVSLASWTVRVYTMMIVPLAFQYTFVDSLTALGRPGTALALSLFRKSLYFLSACLLPFVFQATSSFYAEPISDGVSAAISTAVFLFIDLHTLKPQAAKELPGTPDSLP